MTAPLALAGVWLVAAVLALAPPHHRWRRAAVLVCLGVPLLGWLTVDYGPMMGLLALAAGAAVLRWPPVGRSEPETQSGSRAGPRTGPRTGPEPAE